jgi:transcriptional regulator with XRE-family HTH domain
MLPTPTLGGGMDDSTSFGAWLKQRRKAHDLTQAELARRTGCATVTLQKIELGERRPSEELAIRLAEALELPPEERTTFLRVTRGEHAGERLAPRPPRRWHSRCHNLPAQTTPLIGREQEVAAVSALLRQTAVRLVTLTRPGDAARPGSAFRSPPRCSTTLPMVSTSSTLPRSPSRPSWLRPLQTLSAFD